MKAMIFAAGIGSRLYPLTKKTPKALVEVAGKTMLEHTLLHLKDHGVNQVIINIHHFAGQIRQFVHDKGSFDMQITFSDETGRLLDTGGGLKKASWFFKESGPFIVHNVDVLSNLDLSALYRYHLDKKALATLAVRQRTSSRYLLFDHNRLLCGWENNKSGQQKMTRPVYQVEKLAFSGIQVINPALFDWMPEKQVFSITDTYLIAAKNEKIAGFCETGSWWFDIGNLENLEKARNFINH